MIRTAYTIDQKTVDQWRSDLRRMTKIYRDLPTDVLDERWTEARQLFRTFGDNWSQWVYRELLPKLKESEETWITKLIAKEAWAANAYINTGTLLPSAWDYKTDKFEPSPWSMGKDREKNIRRYQKAFVSALDAIDKYLENGPLERRPAEQRLEVAGVNVVFRNFGRTGEDEAQVDAFLRELRTGLGQIARAGFPSAYKGMTLFVDFNSESMTCGKYQPSTDELTLFPLGLYGDKYSTFTHEIGHRFWFREMSTNARAAWDEELSGAMVKIEPKDIDIFYDRIVAPLIHNEFPPDRQEQLAQIKRVNPDDADRVKWTELADVNTYNYNPNGPTKFDPEEYKKRLLDDVGVSIHLEPITEYARESPVEAFADAFRLWVLKGPGALGPWTREFFKKVVRTGGAKLASRVLWRFLTSPGVDSNR